LYFYILKKYIIIHLVLVLFSCNNGVQEESLGEFSEDSLKIEKVLEHIGDDPTATELYFVGDYYYEKGQYKKAITFFDKISANDDELLVEAKYAKVKSFIKIQEVEKVKPILESLPSTERMKIEFLEGMLMADFFLEIWTSKTVFYYEKLKLEYPQSGVFDYLDVLHEVSKKDTVLAISKLNKLMVTKPNDLNLKLLYLDLQCCKDSASRSLVSASLMSNPDNVELQNYSLEILIDDNLLDSAYFKMSRYSSFSNELGKVLLQKLIASRNVNAELFLDQLIKDNKLSEFESKRYRGDINYQKRNNYKARALYNEALKLNSDDIYIQSQIRKLNWQINSALEQEVPAPNTTITN